jgi:hypothetical protein
LLSGGFRAGKTIIAIVKIITQHLIIPNNEGLIGRLTYRELDDTVQKDFFKLLPPEWIQSWHKSEGNLLLKNGTLVKFRHLDTVSEFELRGMTLGFALIDQCEEITEEVYEILSSRVSLQHVDNRQIILTSNPALFWAYKIFKQEKLNDPDYEVIEFSMLDNAEHLPEDYLAEQLARPEPWKKQFVHGVWDEDLLAERAVIPSEYIKEQSVFVKEPISMLDDILIYEHPNYERPYQIGVDVSEGIGNDFSAFSGYDSKTKEQVCSWRGQVPPEILAQKVELAARHFNNARIVPEINGVGLALLTKLKETAVNIYQRKIYDKIANKNTLALGWKTTIATKPLLIDNFLKYLRSGELKIRDQMCLNEMKTFVYTTDAHKHGIGAEQGFYDDVLIANMLGLYELGENMLNLQPHPWQLQSA